MLYIVPTPIGNLADISFRAIDTLKEVDLILAEDTRTSGKLLKHYSIETPCRAFHQHNEHKILERILEEIESGTIMALISDAGTPGISDPGFLLVRGCVEKNINIQTLPGATAFVPALVNSAFPSDRFVFEGFLPQKKGRATRINQLVEEDRTIVLYESPHRVIRLLGELENAFQNLRLISISRELTKIHEETIRGTATELLTHFKEHPPKGEFVVVVESVKKKRPLN